MFSVEMLGNALRSIEAELQLSVVFLDNQDSPWLSVSQAQ